MGKNLVSTFKWFLPFCLFLFISANVEILPQNNGIIKNLVNQYERGVKLTESQLNLIQPYLQKTNIVKLPVKPLNPSTIIFSEDFASDTLPTGWQIIDNAGFGEIWRFDNPGGRTINTETSSNGFAIFDSDNYGSGEAEDCELITPPIDCSSLTTVILQFDHYFDAGFGGTGVLLVSGDNGVTWDSLDGWSANSTNNAQWESYDISAIAAGQSQVLIDWHWTGDYSWYWAVDDVSIDDGTNPPLPAVIVNPDSGAVGVTVTTNLEWADGGGNPTGYKIYFGTDNPPTNIENGTDLGDSLFYTPVSQLEYYTTYYWQIIPYNNNGDAADCPVWEFRTMSNPNFGGGPADSLSGGYYFANSTDGASGFYSQPTYNWVDISTTGTNLIDSLSDDNVIGPFPIGFTFNYFGVDYNEFWLSSNGWISFSDMTGTSGSQQRNNLTVPTEGGIENMVMWFWDDLNPADADVADRACYYGNDANGDLVVSFINYPEYGADSTGWITGQIILKQNNNVKLQYADHGESIDLLGSTVGIEDSNGTHGIQYLYNGYGGPIFESPVAVEFGVDSTTLPVELASFNANVIDGNVNLTWTTSSEKNNKGFEVQRKSLKGIFTKVGFINGSGTTSENHNYSFSDTEVSSGKYIYRLKQIDFNGSFKYSKEIETDVNVPFVFKLNQNYPNPFNPSTLISYTIPQKGMVNLTIYNSIGEKVMTLVNGITEAGNYNIRFDASRLATGVYFYRLTADDHVSVKKMMLLK